MPVGRKVAIVGAGLVGCGWAIVFARAGWLVALYDNSPDAAGRAIVSIEASLADLQAARLIDDAAAVFARIERVGSIAAALDGASYVQESVLEDVEIKRAVMREIDAAIGPATLVGSSASGLVASLFTEHVACRARCLVAHPVNPPHLVPVVELVPAPWTAPETLAGVRALMDEVGQSPVTVARETEGFLLNRLQSVLLMEAWRLVESGLASVEDVDTTISQGLGLRWSFMGPFQTIDLNAPGGVADYAARFGGLIQRIAASTEQHRVWSPALVGRIERELRARVPAEALAERRAWRDRRLMALARHKADAEPGEADPSH